MRLVRLSILSLILLSASLSGNGVLVVHGTKGAYVNLEQSHIRVNVENQVAITTTSQTFRNNYLPSSNLKFAFPIPESASAMGLRWHINGQWHEAVIAPTPQDTTLPGGGTGTSDEILKAYLGPTPIFFAIEELLLADSLLTVELTYVEMLPFLFGEVTYHYPNDYTQIQTTPLDEQSISFTLRSGRTITALELLSHVADSLSYTGETANIRYTAYETAADTDFRVSFSLSLTELGLYSMSTFFPDTLVPDLHGGGYFVFVAEPSMTESNIVDKVFTLIIDCSGSMSGTKIVQARNAARFIVENLNASDRFNIIDFATDVRAFRPAHVEYTLDNRETALNYIGELNASGATNISGAFEVSISQFAAANDSTANIIIFFTDGNATAGVTVTDGILAIVAEQITLAETEVKIFTFGIGGSVNEQLLTLLASEHGGVAEFLGSDELQARISEFYLMIRNPVVLNTQVEFYPSIISELYPDPLPSLYAGQQLVATGRYSEAAPTSVTLSGTALGAPVSYEYAMDLSDTTRFDYRFLRKVWAKGKIDHLMVEYYIAGEDTPAAESIKAEVIQISVDYGVMTPFTSFIEGPVAIDEEEFADREDRAIPARFELLSNVPNPFNPSTTIRFKVNEPLLATVQIRIYNLLGELVRVLEVFVDGPGIYRVLWDGRNLAGLPVASGTYVYIVDYGAGILAGKMTLVK